MGEQVQKPTTSRAKEAKDGAKAKDLNPKGEEIKAKADEIADLIDDILEENAEQFIKNYVQRGGE